MKVLIGYDGSPFADTAIVDLQNAGLVVRRFTRDRLLRGPDAVLRSVEFALGHSRLAPSRAA